MTKAATNGASPKQRYAMFHAATMVLLTISVVIVAVGCSRNQIMEQQQQQQQQEYTFDHSFEESSSSPQDFLRHLGAATTTTTTTASNATTTEEQETDTNGTATTATATLQEEDTVQLLNEDEGLTMDDTKILPVVEVLSVDVTFEDILKTVVFLMTSWLMAATSQWIGLPSLVGEIMTGFLLGPPFLDVVAYPEAMVLIGSFGLIGLLLDSGINLDIAQLRETGSRAVLMAVVGTILALAVGLGMGHAANSDDFKSSFAIGAAFAPSSFGVASQVLAKGEILNTPMGQVIVASSVVDDILGLILLSLMEVLVMDSPTVLDWIKPFLSSFGYLIVLGSLGIMVVPKLVENKILPRFREENRDFVAFSLLFILLAAYLPLLHYSGASYLTGAFLAGLSFSQIHSVHAQYVQSGPHLKIWLMRIFFAATIGFQVPVKYFTNGDVLNWGFLYFIPVLAKLPVGLLVPRMAGDLPDGFPYDPYWKDVTITTLAMICRGEFNFIVASFALSAGVLEPEQYAAVVFAILLSAVIAPLALSKTIQYYNGKFKTYLESSHKVNRIDGTMDGTRPLFLAIQARTPVAWSLQEKFKRALESAGLIVIDHRSFHTLGLNATDITEIFCQDTIGKVRIPQAFDKSNSTRSADTSDENSEDAEVPTMNEKGFPKTIRESPSRECLAELEEMEYEEEEKEQHEIELRKQIIRDALIACLGPNVDESRYMIQVSQWDTFVFGDTDSGKLDEEKETPDRPRHAGYRFVTPAPSMIGSTQEEEAVILDMPDLDLEAHADLDIGNSSLPNPKRTLRPFSRLCSGSLATHSDVGSTTAEGPKLDLDLWDVDYVAHDQISEGYFMAPLDDTGSQLVTEGCHNHRRSPSEGGGGGGGRAQHRRNPSEGGHRRNPSEGGHRRNPSEGGHRRNPSEGGLAHRQPNHRRNPSQDSFFLDASVLNDYNREIEASTIKDRLHGYIRP